MAKRNPIINRTVIKSAGNNFHYETTLPFKAIKVSGKGNSEKDSCICFIRFTLGTPLLVMLIYRVIPVRRLKITM